MVSKQGIKEILTTFKEIVLEKIRIGTIDWSNETSGLSKRFVLDEIMNLICRQGTCLDRGYYQQPIIISLYSFVGREGTTKSYSQIGEETGDSLEEAFNKLVSKL